ncbi:MAG: hypothetical protein IIV40_03945, partial [Oscillospiraceae bacterium]|nr:hypothetical protein [Oscillospiraceae bacterium]
RHNALNILTAAPNLARFIVHRTRFASFAPREGLKMIIPKTFRKKGKGSILFCKFRFLFCRGLF